MCTRIAPPGRTSSSQTGFVKPLGPHHCASSFGSVQALNTISRGASNTRVILSSRSADSRAGSTLGAMFFLLGTQCGYFYSACFHFPFLQLAQVIIQPAEALFPKSAILFYPLSYVPPGTRSD